MFEFFLTETVSEMIANQRMLAIIMVFLGGLLTSFSPCILTMIPVIVGYIGGSDDQVTKTKGFTLTTTFVFGLATIFAVFGLIASTVGVVFGRLNMVWYYVLAAVAIIMGLRILGVIDFHLPGLQRMPMNLKGYSGAYLMGLSFGMIASVCATPVLAVIITYVAAQGELAYGALLLFVYGIGHGLPLIVAGTFTSLLKKIPRIQRYTHYTKYFSGSILIVVGLFLLMRVRW